MAQGNPIESHYARSGLVAAIRDGLAARGKSVAGVSIGDLAPVDEFHIGGREATAALLDQLAIGREQHFLDVGCGIGGATRFAAATYGCRVTGIDLTADFVAAAAELSGWVGLAGRVAYRQASALDLPFGAAAFDGAYMIHVGMNIADKARLFAEVARVLAPGAAFGVYDVMATGGGAIDFPVPWAGDPAHSALDTPAAYRSLLGDAGFAVVAERDRGQFALDFFEALRARAPATGGVPALGLHLVMGADAPTKIGNMIANIRSGRIAPVEIVARRAARTRT
ncbi:MAG: class I SAM-dependent methyltransferase [Rhodospirillaceae bacterium]